MQICLEEELLTLLHVYLAPLVAVLGVCGELHDLVGFRASQETVPLALQKNHVAKLTREQLLGSKLGRFALYFILAEPARGEYEASEGTHWLDFRRWRC